MTEDTGATGTQTETRQGAPTTASFVRAPEVTAVKFRFISSEEEREWEAWGLGGGGGGATTFSPSGDVPE